ncbi:hypothetical protein I7I50_12325 [Histoplasma capsulatum G186AR]|uniref:Uncharacterized protein n=1 Tax=Ajellomyces capsulatus TaxID=5037 RepID=A0A8H7YA23_AJECA|nr:hypothetical protein I7I52_11363 [Histoplasma capsulatum]QSS70629.1 hypothetical protein I7I50_12325 [Histoplasma capsulatum G186AR]
MNKNSKKRPMNARKRWKRSWCGNPDPAENLVCASGLVIGQRTGSDGRNSFLEVSSKTATSWFDFLRVGRRRPWLLDCSPRMSWH